MALFIEQSGFFEDLSNQGHKKLNKDEILKELFLRDPILPKGCLTIHKNQSTYLSINEFMFQNLNYYITFKLLRQMNNLQLSVQQINNNNFTKSSSKTLETYLMRIFMKIKNFLPQSSSFFIKNGIISLRMSMYVCFLSAESFRNLVKENQILFIETMKYFSKLIKGFDQQKIYSFDDRSDKHHLQQDLSLNRVMMSQSEQILKEQNQIHLNSLGFVKNIKNNNIEEAKLEQYAELFYENNALKSSQTIKILENLSGNVKKYLNYQSQKQDIQKGSSGSSSNSMNLIQVVALQNLSNIGSGGLNYIHLAKISFHYVISYDSERNNGNEYCQKRLVAIKYVKPDRQKLGLEKLNNQKKIVQLIKDRSIYFLKYYESRQEKFQNILIMQYKPSLQNLNDYLSRKKQSMSIITKMGLLLNIASAMAHLNHYQIVHLDLKPANILVQEANKIKIIDFGESYNRLVTKKQHIPGHTFPYVAPEVYELFHRNNNKKISFIGNFSQAQDVYAFGIIMSEILFDSQIFNLPYEKYRQIYLKSEIYKRIFLTPQNLREYGCNVIMKNLFHIMLKCLQLKPQKRPKFQWIKFSLMLIIGAYE